MRTALAMPQFSAAHDPAHRILQTHYDFFGKNPLENGKTMRFKTFLCPIEFLFPELVAVRKIRLQF